ncbi:hypothetical protein WHR41_01526 [Cladosporium halotolerans]|uniref:CENP-V/GFA domain-containing protein n=1 Tax=Cladosporium halotolerans TaxID=1052096 RepID=A0AB34KXX4_9PEZI
MPDLQVPWPAETGVSATYPMACHCGAIQWTITLSPPLLESQSEGKGVYTALECDCTHCERKGLIACHPKAKDVVFTQGLEHRAEYLCGARKNPHWFCGLCGSTLGTDLTWLMENVMHKEPRYTINLRMLKDIRPAELQTRPETYMRSH